MQRTRGQNETVQCRGESGRWLLAEGRQTFREIMSKYGPVFMFTLPVARSPNRVYDATVARLEELGLNSTDQAVVEAIAQAATAASAGPVYFNSMPVAIDTSDGNSLAFLVCVRDSNLCEAVAMRIASR